MRRRKNSENYDIKGYRILKIFPANRDSRVKKSVILTGLFVTGTSEYLPVKPNQTSGGHISFATSEFEKNIPVQPRSGLKFSPDVV